MHGNLTALYAMCAVYLHHVEDGELHVTLCKIAKGVSWNAVFAGDAALDTVVGEADRKRLMLERFQEEVRCRMTLEQRGTRHSRILIHEIYMLQSVTS